VNSACAIEVDEKNGCAAITGPLTFETTPGLYHETERLFLGQAPVSSINLANVSEVDSAGLALLLEWEAMQRKASRTLEIRNAPVGLVSLAALCEADEVMNLSGRVSPS